MHIKTVRLPGVDAEPEVEVTSWVVFELKVERLAERPEPYPYRYVVGYDRANFCGRVSTLIEGYDPERRQIRTVSGRIYVLKGPPQLDADAWQVWLAQVGRVSFVDATGDYWPGYTGEVRLVDSAAALIEAAIAKEGGAVQ